MPRARVCACALLAIAMFATAFEPTAPPEDDEYEILHLHKDNFDAAIDQHDEILVHFHAPWSKRCEIVRPHLRTIQRSSEWGPRITFAESDISDSRGYTTYLEHHGVTRLPALVLFRNGHPELYPPAEPLTMEDVEAWVYRSTQNEALPRGASDQAVNIQMLEAQANAEERIRAIQKEAERQEEAKRRDQQGKQGKTAEKSPPPSPQSQASKQPEQPAQPGPDEGSADAGRKLEEKQPESSVGGCAALADGLSDATFEKVVMDKSRDVFVLFYHQSPGFCAGNGTAYGAFAQQLRDESSSVVAQHMDVRAHKSPFVFEEHELPVAMLFPAEDKRPLEFDQAFTPALLRAFATEHGSTLKSQDKPEL